MSRTQEIRDALAGGAMTFAELHAKVGGDEKKLQQLLYVTRDIRGMGRGEQRSYALVKVKGGGKVAKKTQPRKKAKKKGAARPFKKLVEALARARDGEHAEAARQAKVTQHALTTFAALKAVIEIDEEDVVLATAFRSHEQALEFFQA